MKKRAVRERLCQLDILRRHKLHPFFSELGLTPGQPRILDCLWDRGKGLTQRGLAEACSLDVTTLSRALDRLEAGGLVVRLPHGKSRRANLIALTPQGEEKAKAVAEGFARIDEALWRGFAPEEMEMLMAGLERLRENLRELE